MNTRKQKIIRSIRAQARSTWASGTTFGNRVEWIDWDRMSEGDLFAIREVMYRLRDQEERGQGGLDPVWDAQQ
jgi:hypothetical protein